MNQWKNLHPPSSTLWSNAVLEDFVFYMLKSNVSWLCCFLYLRFDSITPSVLCLQIWRAVNQLKCLLLLELGDITIFYLHQKDFWKITVIKFGLSSLQPAVLENKSTRTSVEFEHNGREKDDGNEKQSDRQDNEYELRRTHGENRYNVNVLQPCRLLARLSIYWSVEEFLADSIWRDSKPHSEQGSQLKLYSQFL